MAPSERNSHRLSQHIQASNALNRAIQINLLSEEEDDDNSKSVRLSKTSGFFQKRVKTTSENGTSQAVKLKKIASSDAPPYPLEFQMYKTKYFPFEAELVSPQIIRPITPTVLASNQSFYNHENVPLAQLIKETYSELSFDGLRRLNNLISDRGIGISSPNRQIFTSILNDIEVTLSSDQPILWVFNGPPGTGKTYLAESIAEALGLRLITIDSTQGPRNSKTFDTLQTTLSHSAPRSFSQFFSTPEKQAKKQQKVAILFDEVEIAFESDRGFWSALSSFLQSPSAKTIPIFITSNVSIEFLETIIKFPDHFRHAFIGKYDFRKFSNNYDFIKRLHRIDTSIEYEQLASTTGYYIKPDKIIDISGNDCDIELGKVTDNVNLIDEALRWDGLLENIQTGSTDIDAFSYAESASFADMLLSVEEPSVKLNIDFADNLQSEFFAHDSSDISSIASNTLLYSSIPEIYVHSQGTSSVARELLERTIHPFCNELKSQGGVVNNSENQIQHWKDLSKKLAARFFDYTKSLQCPHIWTSELSQHVVRIETENYLEAVSRNRGRRKRAYYRYIGEELLNEVLNLFNENSSHIT